MSDKPLTPEKQLLKLIEEPSAKGPLHVALISRQGLSLLSPGAWIGRFAFFRQGFGRWFGANKKRALDIKAVNNLLIFCALGLGVYFAVNFSVSLVNFSRMPELGLKEDTVRPDKSAPVNDVGKRKSVSDYLERIALRDIFKMGPKKAAPGDKSTETEPSQKVIDEIAGLKLVGISWSKDPDAMIEDTRSLKTFFVKRGQMIGNVLVQAIFKDKVVLMYAGQEIELK